MSGQIIPAWLQTAFVQWLTGQLYLDNGGNYRARAPRRIVACNRALKATFPSCREFHEAAHLWMALWAAVPTARIPNKWRANAELHPAQHRS